MSRKQRGNLTFYNRFNNKRSQITLFMVIGLVILSLVVGVIVLREKAIVGELDVGGIIDVPAELGPIQEFITEIVYDVAVGGLEDIGINGGWLSLDDSSLSGQTFITHPDPTSSEVVTRKGITGKVVHKAPYWYFMSSPNECYSLCEFSNKGRPSLRSYSSDNLNRNFDDTSIEAQLDRYIEKNFADNVSIALNSLKNQGYNIKGVGDVNAVTIIGEEDISISVSYKVEVDGPSGEGELNQYFTRIPLNMQEIFNLADEITTAEADNKIFCETFLNLIIQHQGVVPDLPSNLFDNVAGTDYWIMNNVQDFLEEHIFSRYVHMLRLKYTQNYVDNFNNPESNVERVQNGVITGLGLGILSKPYDISVSFFYDPDWNIYLNIAPRDGQIIRTESFSNNILDLVGLNFKKGDFDYDISVPIWITLTDNNTLNEKGYNFQFPIEANIRNSKCITANSIATDIESDEATLLDDPEMWFSDNITLEIQDNFGEPIEDVSVRYSCGPISVPIGKTKLNDDGKAIITSKFPTCQGGLLMLSKEGYLGYDGILLDVFMGEEVYHLVQI